jgi:hypothetical protein
MAVVTLVFDGENGLDQQRRNFLERYHAAFLPNLIIEPRNQLRFQFQGKYLLIIDSAFNARNRRTLEGDADRITRKRFGGIGEVLKIDLEEAARGLVAILTLVFRRHRHFMITKPAQFFPELFGTQANTDVEEITIGVDFRG